MYVHGKGAESVGYQAVKLSLGYGHFMNAIVRIPKELKRQRKKEDLKYRKCIFIFLNSNI